MQARSRLAAFAYIGALLAEPGDRRSCWQLAEAAGHARRGGCRLCWPGTSGTGQRRWPRCSSSSSGRLGDAGAILAMDETAELKKGDRTVGVARQYAGITGQVENCQTVVFAAYVTHRAHAAFDFRLYLPRSWFRGRARRDAGAGARRGRGSPPSRRWPPRWSPPRPGRGCRLPGWPATRSTVAAASSGRRCEKAGKGYVLGVPVNFAHHASLRPHGGHRPPSPRWCRPRRGRPARAGPAARASATTPGRGPPPPRDGTGC